MYTNPYRMYDFLMEQKSITSFANFEKIADTSLFYRRSAKQK